MGGSLSSEATQSDSYSLTALDKLELKTYLLMLSWHTLAYARQIVARGCGNLLLTQE